ncbi:hypothetical protein RDI58_017881 [Solanum bulbocastanum]|uniref:Uncharacterized protein n=1 Tax=Solanum bulbocastanum TaxID=147425 RepID=A0AAN8TFF5_SOLBU
MQVGINMEKHMKSSGSREMMGRFQQNLSRFNPSSASIDSADSSSKKSSVDELDDFCEQGNVKEAVEVLHFLEQ